jgi:hypothetical protein
MHEKKPGTAGEEADAVGCVAPADSLVKAVSLHEETDTRMVR